MHRTPNLFVIGAMKSGTSSLHSCLSSHPDIYMSRIKEPMHFSRSENWKRGTRRYLRLFAGAVDEVYVGESSTEYTKMPFRQGVARRLHDFAPSARLVYIIRDPFDRIVSQYKHMVRRGTEKRTLAEAACGQTDYLTNSYYAYQLRPYLSFFGSEALFVETFETMVAYPRDFYRRIFRWLGVDDWIVPAHLHEPQNASPSEVELISDDSLMGRVALRMRDSYVLQKLLPSVSREWIAGILPKMGHLDFSTEEFQREVGIVRRAVGPILRAWIAELEELNGACYTIWPTRAYDSNEERAESTLTQQIRDAVSRLLRESSTGSGEWAACG